MSGQGRTETLRCPYHSWTYDLQGRLIRAPHMEQQAGFALDACTLSYSHRDVAGFRLRLARIITKTTCI